MMNEFKIGQILTSTEDTIVVKGLSEEQVIIPKGNKVVSVLTNSPR